MDEDAALPSSPRHEVRMQPQRIFCTTAVPVLEVISQDPGKGEHLPSAVQHIIPYQKSVPEHTQEPLNNQEHKSTKQLLAKWFLHLKHWFSPSGGDYLIAPLRNEVVTSTVSWLSSVPHGQRLGAIKDFLGSCVCTRSRAGERRKPWCLMHAEVSFPASRDLISVLWYPYHQRETCSAPLLRICAN